MDTNGRFTFMFINGHNFCLRFYTQSSFWKEVYCKKERICSSFQKGGKQYNSDIVASLESVSIPFII